MNFTDKLKKGFGSAIFWYQAVVYFAIIVLQLFYPDASWVQMIVAAAIFLAILVLVIASGFQTTSVITTKSVPGGGPKDPDDGG